MYQSFTHFTVFHNHFFYTLCMYVCLYVCVKYRPKYLKWNNNLQNALRSKSLLQLDIPFKYYVLLFLV